MILGVYWSYYLPDIIFRVNFFKFKESRGGFDDRPAELSASIYAFNPEKVIKHIKQIHNQYNECNIYICRNGNNLKIGTFNYELYDYDLYVLKKIEDYLNKSWLVFQKSGEIEYSRNENLIELKSSKKELENKYPKNKNIKIFHSSKSNYNSTLKFIHINCYINTKLKSALIMDFKKIAISENLNVFYYNEFVKLDVSNLHISLSNGRQGNNGMRKNYTDIRSFEEKTNALFAKYNITFDFREGFDTNSNGITIETMTDEDFVIDKGMKIKTTANS